MILFPIYYTSESEIAIRRYFIFFLMSIIRYMFTSKEFTSRRPMLEWVVESAILIGFTHLSCRSAVVRARVIIYYAYSQCSNREERMTKKDFFFDIFL